MNKTIKVHHSTLNMLRELKPEYADQYLEGEITNDFIINRLVSEHEELNDPDVLREKEEKLHNEYVSKSEYDKLYDEYASTKKELKELMEEHENKLKELEDKEENLTRELKEQRDIYDKIQSTLTLKENELTQLNEKNMELRQSLPMVKHDLSICQNERDKLDEDYNRLYTHTCECMEKTSLETLYRISCFLFKHKRSMYTMDQLCEIFWRIPNDNMRESLTWTNYKIFPVRKVIQKDQELYCFDCRYLKW